MGDRIVVDSMDIIMPVIAQMHKDTGLVGVYDNNGRGNAIPFRILASALNELAQLRQENADLKLRLKEIPLAEVVISENRTVRAENAELKKRVGELEKGATG